MTTSSLSTTQKHKAFSGEPMRDKQAKYLAGIGSILANRLKEQVFNEVNPRPFFFNILVTPMVWRVEHHVPGHSNDRMNVCSGVFTGGVPGSRPPPEKKRLKNHK